MTDFPSAALLLESQVGTAINPTSGWGSGPSMLSGETTAAWPAANDALFCPFRVPVAVTVYQMACGTGTTTTGNFDLGIYDMAGNRIVSTGSTAKTASGTERIINVTDTLLLPGLYYLAMVTDGVTLYACQTVSNIGMCQLMGMRKMATAFALPSTATFASCTAGYVPLVSAWLRPE